MSCVQRVRVYNLKSRFDAKYIPQSYDFYPALLLVAIKPVVAPGTKLRLVDYSPRTLNSSVSMESSESKNDDRSVTRQHTSGSSLTTTNSFGVNASLSPGAGPEGPSLSGSIGGSFEHSTAVASSTEEMMAAMASHGLQSTGGASMVLKDWASFATVHEHAGEAPWVEWVWGQEFPWDVFQYRNNAQDHVVLPQFVQDRLCDAGAGPGRRSRRRACARKEEVHRVRACGDVRLVRCRRLR